MGHGAERAAVARQAESSGRIVVAQAGPPDPWDGHSDGWLPRGVGAFGELLVEAPLLPVVREHGAELSAGAGALCLFGEIAGDPEASELARQPLAPPVRGAARAAKRAIDLVLASAILVAMAPVLLAAIVAIRLETPGSAIFRQTRLGARGRRFEIYKLRTMHLGNDDSGHRRYVEALMDGEAERHGGLFKLTDDPRITTVGRWLRRFSLDEFPQLLNVLAGDMSIVGPRPPLAHEAERYDARTWLRLQGKPGLTGLWQVNGRCELPFRDQVALDIEYWRRWSLALDLAIVLLTPKALITGRGAA